MVAVKVALLVSSSILLMEQGNPVTSNAGADFCSRLAANSGIDLPADAKPGAGWTADALNFGQRFLFGGSTAIAVGVVPVEPAAIEDYKRLEDMCLPEGKGAVCKLVGPVIFKFTWKGRKTLTPLSSGERAVISLGGTKARCALVA